MDEEKNVTKGTGLVLPCFSHKPEVKPPAVHSWIKARDPDEPNLSLWPKVPLTDRVSMADDGTNFRNCVYKETSK